jgi:hypothetical protein
MTTLGPNNFNSNNDEAKLAIRRMKRPVALPPEVLGTQASVSEGPPSSVSTQRPDKGLPGRRPSIPPGIEKKLNDVAPEGWGFIKNQIIKGRHGNRPDCVMHAPVPAPAPAPAPPAVVYGSLNISGDPKVNVSTAGVTRTAIDFNEPVGQPITLLNDPDQGFSLKTQLYTINPEGSRGQEKITLTVNGKTVEFANNGNLVVDGQVKGSIKATGDIASLALGPDAQVKTALMDDGGGKQIKRFVFTSGDYEVTAALRQPEGAQPYYDLNVAERKDNAADNATGDAIVGQGTTGVDDLLRLKQ